MSPKSEQKLQNPITISLGPFSASKNHRARRKVPLQFLWKLVPFPIFQKIMNMMEITIYFGPLIDLSLKIDLPFSCTLRGVSSIEQSFVLRPFSRNLFSRFRWEWSRKIGCIFLRLSSRYFSRFYFYSLCSIDRFLELCWSGENKIGVQVTEIRFPIDRGRFYFCRMSVLWDNVHRRNFLLEQSTFADISKYIDLMQKISADKWFLDDLGTFAPKINRI